MGYAAAQLFEALRYKSKGRRYNSQWCHSIFHWHNPSGPTMVLGLTQSLTEMNTSNIYWGWGGVKAAGA
jgi:coproporphyrinogen III oxidase